MSNGNEIYISHEERDPEKLEQILRHSSRREDTPMTLVQLPGSKQQNSNLRFPLRQGQVTIVNMGMTPPATFDEKIDPFEWYLRRNTPDLRSTLAQDGGIGELTSQRRSRIGVNPMEDTNVMVPSQAHKRYPVNVDVQENEQTTRIRPLSSQQNRETKSQPEIKETKLQTNNLADNKIKREKKSYRLETSNKDPLPALDVIMNSLSNHNRKVTVMPAQYSYTDQKSPFISEKGRDERSRRPSSRVRVLLMLDEWDEDDRLDNEKRRGRQAKGDRGRGRDKYGRGGSEDVSSGSSCSDQSRRDYNSDKYPQDGKRKDKAGRGGKSDKDGDSGRYKGGEGSKRGRKPGDGDDIGSEGGRGRGGRRPGDQGYDKRENGDRSRRDGSDGGFSNDRKGRGEKDRDKRGGRPGDRDYNGRKYGDGPRSAGGSDDEDRDKRDRRDKDKDKRGGRPGDRDYNGKKYGDGPRSAGGSDDEDKRGGRDKDKDKRGGRPGDRDYDERKYGDGPRSRDRSEFDEDNGDKKGRKENDRKGKGKPGGDRDDASKYRFVTMPKYATTLTTRRRYHLQVIDHDMKEPWFNSCFNISKENNVDFNYEGPVKITPYYVADKFA